MATEPKKSTAEATPEAVSAGKPKGWTNKPRIGGTAKRKEEKGK